MKSNFKSKLTYILIGILMIAVISLIFQDLHLSVFAKTHYNFDLMKEAKNNKT